MAWVRFIYVFALSTILFAEFGNAAPGSPQRMTLPSHPPAFAIHPVTTGISAHVHEYTPIPRDGFRSWSLFLVCNSDWVRPQSAAKLEQLHQQFLNFGRAIGRDNLAVWFLSADGVNGGSMITVDVERALFFCRKFNLPAKDGPYLLFATRYPGNPFAPGVDPVPADVGNHFILSLNHVSPDDTTHLLRAVADQIVTSDFTNVDMESRQYLEVWKRTFTNLLTGELSKVSLTLDTGLSSTSVAQPSSTLLEGLKSTNAAAPLNFGSKLMAKRADKTPVRLTVFLAERTDLLLDGALGVYAGTLALALQNLDAQGDRSEVSDPIVVNLTVPGASEYTPKTVTVSRLQQWITVELHVPDPQKTGVLVSASSGPEDPGASVELEVTRPRFVLSAVNTSILGWGLGTTQIRVTAHGMRSTSGFAVSLTSDGGALDAGKVTLDADGTGTTTLRSDSSPRATVRLADPNLDASALAVAFRAPFLFLAAATLGGLLGAYLRGRGRRKWLKALSIGVASALLMTVGQAVGCTDWIANALGAKSVASTGEAVIFFLGAIASLIGVSAFIPVTAKK